MDGQLRMSEPTVMVSVRIDEEFLAEIEAGTTSWNKDDIVGWGLVIAGESFQEGKRTGPVFLGQDGGTSSRHVGTWEVY